MKQEAELIRECLEHRHPQVLLIHTSMHLPFDYRRGNTRRDIRKDVVSQLVELMRPHGMRIGVTR